MTCCANSKLTARQWLIVAAIGSVHFTAAICVSLQAPFYPEKAEEKNATASQYGFVFGIYELVSCVASPIIGNYVDLIGAKTLLNGGILTAGISCILFGLLDYVPGPSPFVELSFFIRAVEALGSSAAVTSAFAITAATFPDNLATTFATLEIFYGLGYVVGPTLGGVLFSLGGYMVPFVVVGGVLVCDAVFIFFIMPKYPGNKLDKKGKLLDILKVPAVLLDSMAITGVSMCLGFQSATLEPHIRVFGLSAVSLGFVFVAHGATYALTSPIIGRLCDTVVNPRYFIMLGSITVLTSVFLIGPAPFLPLEPSLPLVLAGLFFLGLSMSLVMVSAFTDAIRSAVSAGFRDDIGTYALVSGLWAASFSFGDFVGPSVGGLLVDWVGFRWGTMAIVLVQVIVLTSLITYAIRQRYLRRKRPAREFAAHITLDPKEREPLNAPPEAYGSCNGKSANGMANGIALTTVVSVES